MEIVGERVLGAPIEVVWRGLFDPEVLKQCIPGGEEVSMTGEGSYAIRMTTAIGPMKARMSGKLNILDSVPPESCTLSFEGNGGAIGFAKGSSTVVLTAEGDATRLNYAAQTQISGKLAQLGSRLIDGVAKKLSTEFFDRFESAVAGPAPVEAAGGAGPDVESGAAQGWLKRNLARISQS
ncbi:Carbon monoxide dehydrogenase [Burkholderiales bacterium 8X]|nr:Carbon monoxide dehydrogenase [Burkholderiales bacterium 8X]